MCDIRRNRGRLQFRLCPPTAEATAALLEREAGVWLMTHAKMAGVPAELRDAFTCASAEHYHSLYRAAIWIISHLTDWRTFDTCPKGRRKREFRSDTRGHGASSRLAEHRPPPGIR